MSAISLIIPVYNVEPYLAECLNSCINQTFRDLEIICINDCSTDKSGQILDEYARQDKRIKIINHSSNRGLGAARNTGIVAAEGDYCWFIDSDDYILLNACEILNDIIAEYKTDIIRFNRIDYNYDISTGKKRILVQEPYSWKPNVIYTKKDYSKLGMLEVSACMFITSTILLKTVRFREGVIHEDNDFTPILFSKADTIYNVNYSLYCVRQRMGSIIRNPDGFSEKRLIDNISSINALYDYIISTKLPKKHFCTRTIIVLYLCILSDYNKYSELKTKKLNNIIRKTKKLIYPFILYQNIINGIAYLSENSIILKIIKNILKKIYQSILKN